MIEFLTVWQILFLILGQNGQPQLQEMCQEISWRTSGRPLFFSGALFINVSTLHNLTISSYSQSMRMRKYICCMNAPPSCTWMIKTWPWSTAMMTNLMKTFNSTPAVPFLATLFLAATSSCTPPMAWRRAPRTTMMMGGILTMKLVCLTCHTRKVYKYLASYL